MAGDAQKSNRVESLALNGVFAAVSFFLLFLLPVATDTGPANSGWWTQPWLMPSATLAILCLANLITLARGWIQLRSSPPQAAETGEAWAAIRGWFRPLEFFLYFLAYIWLLGRIGYFFSTLLFIQFLLVRTGLRSLRWILAGFGAALVMTVVFRWGLGIWVPTADIYALLPDAARKFMTKWF